MPNPLAALDGLVGRLTNRIIRRTPRDLIAVPADEAIVSFTFDDVPETALSAGAAILEAHGLRGTFYIAGGLEGRAEPGRTLITAQGCRDLSARGHEIGCHTFSHRNLRHLGRSALERDLARNARHLDALDPRTGRRNFAFPYNAGALGKRALMARAYRTCRAGGEAINRGPTDPAFLRAVELRQPEEQGRGAMRWVDALAARPGWLIFFTHDVAPRPTPYGWTPRAFEDLVAHTLSRGCRILTVDAALDRMGLREAER